MIGICKGQASAPLVRAEFSVRFRATCINPARRAEDHSLARLENMVAMSSQTRVVGAALGVVRVEQYEGIDDLGATCAPLPAMPYNSALSFPDKVISQCFTPYRLQNAINNIADYKYELKEIS